MKTELRVSENKLEIGSLLKEIQSVEHKVLLWQKWDNGKRCIHNAKILDVDFLTQSLILSSLDEVFKLKRDYAIYLKSQHKSLLFRSDSSLLTEDMLVLGIPKQVRVLEYRENPRVHFNRSDNRDVGLYILTSGANKLFFKVKCLDVSVKGIAFELAPKNLSSFHVGEKILVTSMNGKSIAPEMQGIIRYIVKSHVQKNPLVYRMGVEFSEKYPEVVINSNFQIDQPD